MEDAVRIWDEILKTVQTLTTWPLIVFYLALIFRHSIKISSRALFARLSKVKYKGVEAEFDLERLRIFAAQSSPELVKEVLLKLDAKIEDVQEKTDEDKLDDEDKRDVPDADE